MDTTTQSIDLTDRPAEPEDDATFVETPVSDTTVGDVTTLGDVTTDGPAAIPTWVIPVDEIARLLDAQPMVDLTSTSVAQLRPTHRLRTAAAIGALIIGALIIGPPVFGRHGGSETGAVPLAPRVSISSVTFGNDDAVVIGAPAQP